MTKVWKITSSTPRMGGGGPPLKEYFLVAISDQSAALKALRYRRPDVEASKLTVVGEINTDNLEWQWLDLQEGQIALRQAVILFIWDTLRKTPKPNRKAEDKEIVRTRPCAY
jgi:cytolysin (calcineurin-like family phosphatase)